MSDGGSTQGTEDLDPSQPSMAHELREYYGRMADKEIMEERFQLLNFDYHEEQVVRTFRLDHDEQLSEPNSDFEARYEAEFIAARKDHNEALQLADIARRTCLDKGIEVEEIAPGDLPVLGTSSSDHQGSSPAVELWPEDETPMSRAQSHFILSGGHNLTDMLGRTNRRLASDTCLVARERVHRARARADVEHWIRTTAIEQLATSPISTTEAELNNEAPRAVPEAITLSPPEQHPDVNLESGHAFSVSQGLNSVGALFSPPVLGSDDKITSIPAVDCRSLDLA